MANKKKPDIRVPNPLTDAEEKIISDFFNALPTITSKLYSISTDDVKGFKKVSAEEIDYINDVVTEMSSPSNLVASNVKVTNIEASRTATKQFEKIASSFNQAGQLFSRNSMQSDSYGYQQAAIFEADVQNAIDAGIQGAIETKERLESNRKKRNAAATATRQANAAKLAETEAAKIADTAAKT